eukprot:TRINITY_DN0_c1570_g1_i1.p1 TRINITY_DN0_c1570_g1~~TRINITY_DN0_c1570_g1_i1.p1  ORF type:complete len:115 (-),score=42.47 TRINITY_DN0_c1570_g1_i1:80-424(-)
MNQNTGQVSISEGPITKFKYTNMERHPVEEIQKNRLAEEEEMRLAMYAATYGVYMPIRMMRERNFLARPTRLPGLGLPSSTLGLDIAMNRLNKIEFEDYLGRDTVKMPKIDFMI